MTLTSDRPDTRLQLDRDQAERFLAALDPDAEQFTFQTFDDNKERRDATKGESKPDALARCFHASLARIWDQLATLNAKGAGIFVTVNLTTLGERRSNKNIVAVRAVFADLDGAPLEPVLAAGEPKAHIITETSPGKFHVYWRVTRMPREDFSAAQEAIAQRYGSDPKVKDLARVMRLPGFMHRKGTPFLARIVEATDAAPYRWIEQLAEIFRDPWKDINPPKQKGGTSNWRDLNTMAVARSDDWFPALFSGAYRSGETWRVTSKSLGRNLQEDIGLHPQFGINDFGEERSYTPIDLVAKWRQMSDAREAVEWLARRLGEDPKKYLGANGDDKAKDEAARVLDELNRDNAVVLDGGRVMVLRFERDERKIGGEPYTYFLPVYLRPSDFKMLYLNRLVKIGKDRFDKDQFMDAGTWWLRHRQRRQYRGVTFVPAGASVIDGKLNLWKGWGVEPKKGDWNLMRRHIREVLAAGDEAVDDYIIKWHAWAVQHPAEQAEVAPTFISEDRGTGKGTLGKAMCRIFGQHGLHLSSPEHLTGRFNEHLRQCCYIFADEAYGPKDKSAEGQLKRLITEDTVQFEPKGRAPVTEPNRLHITIASNNDWVVPAGAHERRFVVQRVDETHRQDPAWFGPLYKELASGGREAILYDLLRIDLGDWHPRQIVRTAALAEQQDESLSPLDAWWVEILQTGELVGSIKYEPNKVVSNTYDEDITDEENDGFGGKRTRKRRVRREGLFDSAKASSPKLRGVTEHALGRYLRNKGAERKRVKRRRGWHFPSLDWCRQEWKKTFPATTWSDPDVTEWQERAEWHEDQGGSGSKSAAKAEDEDDFPF
jgi:hypothetical protein